MPNYCDNELNLSCPSNPQKIKDLWDLMTADHDSEGRVDFLRFLCPEEEDTYGWRCENWGTKWDICDEDLRLEDGKIMGTFRTAWAPPTPAIMTYWKKNPEVVVDLKYIEMGCEFCGWLTLDEGFEANECEPDPTGGWEGGGRYVQPITKKRMWYGHEEDDQREISEMTQEEWLALSEDTEDVSQPLGEYVYEMNWWHN